MHILIAGCVDPVLIFSFLGAVVLSFVTGLIALLGKFERPERRMIFSWISIIGGVVVVVIAGQDGAFGTPIGLLFIIPLILGVTGLLRCKQPARPASSEAANNNRPNDKQ